MKCLKIAWSANASKPIHNQHRVLWKYEENVSVSSLPQFIPPLASERPVLQLRELRSNLYVFGLRVELF